MGIAGDTPGYRKTREDALLWDAFRWLARRAGGVRAGDNPEGEAAPRPSVLTRWARLHSKPFVLAAKARLHLKPLVLTPRASLRSKTAGVSPKARLHDNR